MIEHVEQLSPGVHYQPVTGYSLHKTHRGNRPKTPTRLNLRGPRYFWYSTTHNLFSFIGLSRLYSSYFCLLFFLSYPGILIIAMAQGASVDVWWMP